MSEGQAIDPRLLFGEENPLQLSQCLACTLIAFKTLFATSAEIAHGMDISLAHTKWLIQNPVKTRFHYHFPFPKLVIFPPGFERGKTSQLWRTKIEICRHLRYARLVIAFLVTTGTFRILYVSPILDLV